MLNEPYALKTSSLTKTYKLYDQPIDRLKEVLHPFRRIYHHEFNALKGIDLEVKRGQTLGILGRNGSGKSTLLKIITGVLSPTSGSVEVCGKVAALLELGTGFNPELTGYENIFFNGALMGYSRCEMEAKVSSILDFADIGEFINQPVKMYSSGMFARLAFALATNVDPDILIVDEALSVGDVFFQAKCFDRFKEFQSKGRTILFVTHSLDTVIRNCTSAICLDEGRIVCQGTAAEAVDFFKKLHSGGGASDSSDMEPGSIVSDRTTKFSSAYELNPAMDSYGSYDAEIEDFAILNSKGIASSVFEVGSVVDILLKVEVRNPIESLIAAFSVKTMDGLEVVGTNTQLQRIDLRDLIERRFGEVRFRLPLFIRPGEYLLSLGLTHFDSNGNLKVYHRFYNLLKFTVIGRVDYAGTGLFLPAISIEMKCDE